MASGAGLGFGFRGSRFRASLYLIRRLGGRCGHRFFGCDAGGLGPRLAPYIYIYIYEFSPPSFASRIREMRFNLSDEDCGDLFPLGEITEGLDYGLGGLGAECTS